MIIFLLLLLGICLGSFVNALTWRLYQQERLRQRKPKNLHVQLKALSISRGRSMCPDCKHQLHAKDLVPVVSWLSLAGKCRYCHKSISVQYPVVELLAGALFVVSYILWPYALTDLAQIAAFGLWLALVTGFVAHSVYDSKWYMLLDRITIPLTILGVLFVGLQTYIAGDLQHLVGPMLGAAVLFGLFYALFQISRGTWIGGGDVKLASLLGLLAGGIIEVTLLLFIASVLGTLFAVLAALVKKQPLHAATRIPFGPFLLLATYLVVLTGAAVLEWYTQLLVVS